MLTHIHPCISQFAHQGRSLVHWPLSAQLISSELPSAQSPFAHLRRYLSCRDVLHHVGRRYSALIAHMDSCANPAPSLYLGCTLGIQVFAGCCQPLLGEGPSRCYLCESFSACLDPYPGCSCGAHTRSFPQDYGLPGRLSRSALGVIHTIATSVWGLFRSCSHSLMFRPADLLATQVASTAVLSSTEQPWRLHPGISQLVTSL